MTDGEWRYNRNLLPEEIYIEKHLMGMKEQCLDFTDISQEANKIRYQFFINWITSQYDMLKTIQESENRKFQKSLLKLQCIKCEKTFQYQEELREHVM